jgi:2-polyprenyl-3-methyl-5-hydroxy-6-metoxy-1,4-benzoquinol methylase
MHQSSYHLMDQFRELVLRHFQPGIIRVLDVGSRDLCPTYRELFSDRERFAYFGLDIISGPNVDYVPRDPYVWEELKDESFEVIISGQAFEHIEFPWLIMEEMNRALKKNGLICIIAPSRGPEHRYPVDCWRFYPDGFRALAKWCGLEVVESKTSWGASGFIDESDQWGDSMCILLKAVSNTGSPAHMSFGSKATCMRNRLSPLAVASKDHNFSIERKDVIDLLIAEGIPAKRVLEIGCAGGATGRKLKEMLPVEYYIGVEISQQAAVLAQQYLDKVIVTDVEKTDLRDYGVREGECSLVLVLDVLEHLYDPWNTLASLTEYLKPEGYVVASLSNVQNIGIVRDLIKGKWEYKDTGILDATHLRFFTLAEIERLFSGAGLSVQRIARVLNSQLPADLQEKGNTLTCENISISNLSKDEVTEFLVYQYLIVARKRI